MLDLEGKTLLEHGMLELEETSHGTWNVETRIIEYSTSTKRIIENLTAFSLLPLIWQVEKTDIQTGEIDCPSSQGE